MRYFDDFCKSADSFVGSLKPKTAVWLAFCMLLLYSAVVVIMNPVFSRDANEYAALVEAFRMGAFERAFPAHLPTLYTLAAGILCLITPLPAMLALLTVNALATAFSVFPLYRILKRCVPARWAGWGTVLFAMIPKVLADCIAPQVDSGRVLFFLLALCLILEENKKINLRSLFLIGIAFGMLMLVRAEGILLVGILCFIHLLKILCSRFLPSLPRRFACAAGRICITLAVALAVIAPRMIQMYKLTGIPALDSRQSNAVKGLLEGVRIDPPVVSGNRSGSVETEEESGRGWVTTDVDQIVDQPRFFRNLPESFFWGYIPFTALGILCFIIRWKRPSPDMVLLWLTLVLYDLMYFLLRAGAGRYLLLNPCLVMPFTLNGMRNVIGAARWCLGRFRYLLIVPLTAAVFVMALYSWKKIPTYGKHRYFKEIGRHLPGESLRNPGVARPVVLMIGADRGVGYYNDLNVIRYFKNGLNRLRTLDDILRNGVSTGYAFYWTTAEMPEYVYIDAIVLDGKNEADSVAGAISLLDTPVQCGRLLLYRVKSGPEAK